MLHFKKRLLEEMLSREPEHDTPVETETETVTADYEAAAHKRQRGMSYVGATLAEPVSAGDAVPRGVATVVGPGIDAVPRGVATVIGLGIASASAAPRPTKQEIRKMIATAGCPGGKQFSHKKHTCARERGNDDVDVDADVSVAPYASQGSTSLSECDYDELNQDHVVIGEIVELDTAADEQAHQGQQSQCQSQSSTYLKIKLNLRGSSATSTEQSDAAQSTDAEVVKRAVEQAQNTAAHNNAAVALLQLLSHTS